MKEKNLVIQLLRSGIIAMKTTRTQISSYIIIVLAAINLENQEDKSGKT